MGEKRAKKVAKRAGKKRAVSTARKPSNKIASGDTFLDKADHRYHLITTLKEDFASPVSIHYEAGSVVEVSAHADIPGGRLSFPMPSVVAMYLNMSSKAHKEAKSLKEQLEYFESSFSPGHFHLKSPATLLFDLLEYRIASVVFAFTALEAFANQVIPTTYQYTRIGRKSTEVMNKEQIERWVSLEEKFTKVLPEVQGVTSPVDEPVWKVFLTLRDERDRLIHLKHRDIYRDTEKNDNPGEEAIWKTLLDEAHPNYAQVLRPLFEHYYPDADTRWRWMTKAPYWKTDES